MVQHSVAARAARAVKRSVAAWLPRTPQVTLHQGTLAAVDLGTNTAHFTFPDPTAGTLPGVRYLQAYTPDNPPQEGDVVWAQAHGTDLLILGRHVIPNNTVIVP